MPLLNYSDIKSLIPDSVVKYYGNKYKLYEAIMENCTKHVPNGSFVKKGDLLYVIKLKASSTEYWRVIVRSPYSGYIEYNQSVNLPRSMYLEYLNDNLNFVIFYENEHEIYFTYDLEIDKITNTARVVWETEAICRYGEQVGAFELNIKSNHPCLHFRYKGFRLNVNDRLFFVDEKGNPIINLTVVRSEHKFKTQYKEVDILLSDTDIKALKNSQLSKIAIIFANEDSRITLNECPFNSPYDLSDAVLPYHKAFQLYLDAYCSALEIAEISYQSDVKQASCEIATDHCHVYLMKDLRNGYHKIGISKDPQYREKTLQSEQPEIEMICHKRYPSRKIAEAIEAALHKAYGEQRIRGEWFNLTATDVQMLRETLS